MRFTIRELMLATIIVGMSISWWIEWSSRSGIWGVVVKGGDTVVHGLNPGDKVEYEVLPDGNVAKRVIRRR